MNAWKTIQRWFSLAGIFLAALSVITLLHKLANVELAGLFQDFIAYYQAVTRAVVSWLPELVNLHAPEIVHDYWVLSFWLTTVMISSLRQADPIPLNIMGHVGMYLFILVLGYTFIGLLVGLSIFAFIRRPRLANEMSHSPSMISCQIEWLPRSVRRSQPIVSMAQMHQVPAGK